MRTALPLRFLIPAMALLALPACNLSGLQVAVGGGGPSYGSYGGYAAPSYGYGYSPPVYGHGYGVPVYRVVPRHYYGLMDHPGRGHSRWGNAYGNPYSNNGRCDDARYETSNGGRAQPGTDERDCRRFGHGLK